MRVPSGRRTALGALCMVIVLGAGCLDSEVVRCASGQVCPTTQVCNEVHGGCVRADQLASCAGLADGDPCDIASQPVGTCDRGVCLNQRCGDGVLQGLEQCDGSAFRPVDAAPDADPTLCTSYGFYLDAPGTAVKCDARCQLDVNSCQGWCGDGVVNGGELCDGTDLGMSVAGAAVADCTDLGFYDPGAVSCTPLCTYNTGACAGFCGDGLVNGGELCDGAPPTQACVDLGYDAGALTCSNASCSASFAGCQLIGWKRVPCNATTNLGVIAAVPGTDLAWAAAPRPTGPLIRFDGQAWAVVDAPIYGTVQGISATGPDHVWFASSDALHHHDGQSFSEIGASDGLVLTGAYYQTVWSSGPNDVYLFSNAAEGSYHFDGTSWTADPSIPAPERALAAWGTGPDDVWMIERHGTNTEPVHHFDGSSWTAHDVGLTNLSAIWGDGDTVLVAGRLASSHTAIARYQAGSWTVHPLGSTDEIRSMWGRSADDVIALASYSVFHFDGARVLLLDALFDSLGRGLYGITGTATSGHVLAIGENGLAVRFPGALLTTFTPAETRVYGSLAGIWGSERDALFAITQIDNFGVSQVMHYAGTVPDYPWAWTEVGQITGRTLTGVWSSGPGDVWVTATSGVNGEIYRGDQTAIALDHQLAQGEGHAFAIHGTGPGDVWVAGTSRVWHHDGTAWSEAHHAAGLGALLGVWARSPTDVFAVGEGGAIVHFDGTSWQPMSSGTTRTLRGVYATATAAYAVGDGGTVLRHDGAAWQPMASNVVLDLYAIHGTGDDDLFAVGDSGTIIHHDGIGWGPIRNPALDRLTGVWASEATSFFVGGPSSSSQPSMQRLFRSGW